MHATLEQLRFANQAERLQRLGNAIADYVANQGGSASIEDVLDGAAEKCQTTSGQMKYPLSYADYAGWVTIDYGTGFVTTRREANFV